MNFGLCPAYEFWLFYNSVVLKETFLWRSFGNGLRLTGIDRSGRFLGNVRELEVGWWLL